MLGSVTSAPPPLMTSVLYEPIAPPAALPPEDVRQSQFTPMTRPRDAQNVVADSPGLPMPPSIVPVLVPGVAESGGTGKVLAFGSDTRLSATLMLPPSVNPVTAPAVHAPTPGRGVYN